MNWWKKTAQIRNFEDRNQYNDIIRRLRAFADSLGYASKLIYMTARGARQMVAELNDHKAMSSFPNIQGVLRQADRVALDSPDKFARCCIAAAEMLMHIADDLEEQRHAFLEGDEADKVKKGLVDDE
jgi:hypothetical protein